MLQIPDGSITKSFHAEARPPKVNSEKDQSGTAKTGDPVPADLNEDPGMQL